VESISLDGTDLQVETMDAPEQLPDQDRADRQPSEVPIQSDEACPKVVSDSEPPKVRYVR
jgi:hypothetical protein